MPAAYPNLGCGSRRHPEWMNIAIASQIGVPVQRVNELVRGRRGVRPETARLLSQAPNTTPDFWIVLQSAYHFARTPSSKAG